ncbi:hypothetical protein LguiA_005923 [Lonicera macranthoides]
MIKRRFYKHEHGEKDDPSDSSSSSDSEPEAEATEETDEEEEEEDVVAEVRENNEACSSSSGSFISLFSSLLSFYSKCYESEDSSANEVELDSSGLATNDDDLVTLNDRKNLSEIQTSDRRNAEIVDSEYNTNDVKDEIPSDVPDCVLKSKSVFRCKLCPRIVCLTEETLRAHLESKSSQPSVMKQLLALCLWLYHLYMLLASLWFSLLYEIIQKNAVFVSVWMCMQTETECARHARSEKLLSEGRLKLMLNSDGEIEGETHQERHASTLAAAEKSVSSKKKNKGRQRQRKRVKKKTGEDGTVENTIKSMKKPTKKRRKTDS